MKGKGRILKIIRREIERLPENYIVLFVTDAKRYIETNLCILRVFVNEKGYYGIYVTVNRPYSTLFQFLKDKKIKVERIFFIDCITKLTGEKVKLTKNCLYLSSPQNLTELGIALSQATSAMGKQKNRFLFLDSLSTMAIYNSLQTLARFSHFLTTKIRVCKLKAGIIISLEKEVDKKLLSVMEELCDKVVEVK